MRAKTLHTVALLATLGLAFGAYAYMERGASPRPSATDRPGDVPRTSPAPEDCGARDAGDCPPRSAEATDRRTRAAEEACLEAGYLCAGLSEEEPLRIVHFPRRTDVLTVRVPTPSHEDGRTAERLRRAAVRGVQAWEGHPFPLRIVDERRPEPADVEVRWTRQIDGQTLGRTDRRIRTGPAGTDYRVSGLTLATRVPGAPSRITDERSLELTAAHEMGHALGLPHSDDERDLMYPRKTATHPSARDYRTLQALYRIPSGTRIVRRKGGQRSP